MDLMWIVILTLTGAEVNAFGGYVGSMASELETDLITDITSNYNKYVRPVRNFSDSIAIEIAAYPVQVLTLKEKEQSLRVSMEVTMNWTDIHLTWNPADYAGIDHVIMSMDDVWIPDITLYNNVDENFKPNDVFTRTRVRVDHNGSVIWSNPAILNVFCKVNVVAFPFDTQNCSFLFGSWSYSGAYVDLINGGVQEQRQPMQLNGEWDFVRFEGHRHVLVYSCCPDPYIDVTFYLTIRRRAFFYTYYLVMPSAIILCLALMVFCLPAESGEKASLVVTVLLAMVVYLLLLTQLMPPTSDGVPVVGQFFGAIVALLSMASTLTILVLNVHHQGDTGELAPQWLVNFLLAKVGKMVCLSDVCDNVIRQVEEYKRTEPRGTEADHGYHHHRNKVTQPPSVSFANGHVHSAGSVIPSSPLNGRYKKHSLSAGFYEPSIMDNHSSNSNEMTMDIFSLSHLGFDNAAFEQAAETMENNTMDTSAIAQSDSLGSDIQAIRADIADIRKHFHARLRLSKQKNLSKREWRTLAMVVDRCCFIFMTLVTVIVCTCIFVIGLQASNNSGM